MTFLKTIVLLCGSVFLLSNFANAQENDTKSGPPDGSDENICGLVSPALIKLNVSIWDSKAKTPIKNLQYRDFEILDGKDFHEIEFFQKSDVVSPTRGLGNHFVLGFALSDFKRNKWHYLKVRLKTAKSSRNIVVRVTPSRYFH